MFICKVTKSQVCHRILTLKKEKKKGGGGILLSEDSIPVSSYSLQGLQHNDTVSSDNLQEPDHKKHKLIL